MQLSSPAGQFRTMLAFLSFLTLVGCSKEKSVPTQSPVSPGPILSNRTPLPDDAEFKATLPQATGVAGYVGSKSCQECHEDQFQSWHRSYHRTMTQVAA